MRICHPDHIINVYKNLKGFSKNHWHIFHEENNISVIVLIKKKYYYKNIYKAIPLFTILKIRVGPTLNDTPRPVIENNG